MSKAIQHGGEWWSQAEDGSWLRWNATDYRWDPQPGGPPFPVDRPEDAPGGAVTMETPPPEAAAAAPPAPSPTPAAAGPDPVARRLREFEPADGKGRVAIVLVGITVLTALGTAPMLFHRAASATAVFRENPTLAGISTFSVFALLAAAIASIVWFKGAYDNGPALGATDLRYTPGWAIGCWFIPIGNLFIPKQIADDIWRTSDPTLPADLGARWKFTRVPGLLHIWWAAWIAQGVLSLTANGVTENALTDGDLDSYKAGIGVEGAAELAVIISGLLFIKIIRSVTERQRERARVLSSTSPEAAGSPG